MSDVVELSSLDSEGEVVTCGLNQEPVGSIYTEGFEAVWYGPEAARRRADVDSCPGCMQGAVEIMSRVYGG